MALWTSYRCSMAPGVRDPQTEMRRLHPSVAASHETRADVHGASVTCWTWSQELYKHNLI